MAMLETRNGTRNESLLRLVAYFFRVDPPLLSPSPTQRST